jgi:hypothetical protein
MAKQTAEEIITVSVFGEDEQRTLAFPRPDNLTDAEILAKDWAIDGRQILVPVVCRTDEEDRTFGSVLASRCRFKLASRRFLRQGCPVLSAARSPCRTS